MTLASADFNALTAGEALNDEAVWTGGTGVVAFDDGTRNVVGLNTGDSQFILHTATPGSPDYLVACDVYLGSNYGAKGVVGRAPDSSNCYNLRISSGSYYSLQLYRFVDGSATKIGEDLLYDVSDGETHRITLKMTGTSIEGYLDDEETPRIGPITDSNLTAAGQAGLRSYGGNNGTTYTSTATGLFWDNFEIGSSGSTAEASAAISGALDDVLGSLPVGVLNTASAAVSGALADATGAAALASVNPVSCAVGGLLDDVAGAIAALAVTSDNFVVSGILDDVTGAVLADAVNPSVASVSGVLSDATGSAIVAVLNQSDAVAAGSLEGVSGAVSLVAVNDAAASIHALLENVSGRVFVGIENPVVVSVELNPIQIIFQDRMDRFGSDAFYEGAPCRLKFEYAGQEDVGHGSQDQAIIKVLWVDFPLRPTGRFTVDGDEWKVLQPLGKADGHRQGVQRALLCGTGRTFSVER